MDLLHAKGREYQIPSLDTSPSSARMLDGAGIYNHAAIYSDTDAWNREEDGVYKFS